MGQIHVEPLIQSLLKTLRLQGVAATILFAHNGPDGKPVAKIASNSDKAGTDTALRWLQKVDASVLGAAARALHEAPNGRPTCSICGLARDTWLTLPKDLQDRHYTLAQAVLDTARESAGMAQVLD